MKTPHGGNWAEMTVRDHVAAQVLAVIVANANEFPIANGVTAVSLAFDAAQSFVNEKIRRDERTHEESRLECAQAIDAIIDKERHR